MRLSVLPLLMTALPATMSASFVSTSFITPEKDVDYFIIDAPTGCQEHRKDGRAIISQEFANNLLVQAGYPPSCDQDGGIIVQTSVISATSPVHRDAYYNQDGTKTLVSEGTPVAFITVNNNEDAHFMHKDKQVPIKENQLVQFDGSLEHNTAVESGVVMMIGPFELPTFNMVGRPVVPSCESRKAAKCCTDNTVCALCPTRKNGGKKKGKRWRRGTSGLECVSTIKSGQAGCAQCVAAPRRYLSTNESPFHRRLGEMTPFDISLLISETGGDPQGTVKEKEGLLPEEHIEALKKYLDKLGEEQVDDYYDKDFYEVVDGAVLVELIGKDNIKNLLDFFYESVGSEMPIQNVQVRRTYMTDQDERVIPFHVAKLYENRTTLAVVLDNAEDCEGGELQFVNQDGVYHSQRIPGKGVVSGPDVIHGIASHQGTRYSLFFVGVPGSECVFSSLFQ